MKGKSRRFVFAIAALAAASSASAELLCTMPNGVTVTKQIGDCPRDALVVQRPDGEVLRTAPPPAPPQPKAPRATHAADPAPAPRQAAAAPPPPNAYDFADLICKAFRQSGASECRVHSNVFTASYIEVTAAIAPHQALVVCKDVVAAVHQKTSTFSQRAWEIKIFSPFSGNRPIAACDL